MVFICFSFLFITRRVILLKQDVFLKYIYNDLFVAKNNFLNFPHNIYYIYIYASSSSEARLIFQRFKYFFVYSVSSRNQFLSFYRVQAKKVKRGFTLQAVVSSELEAHFLHLLWLMNFSQWTRILYFLMKKY